MLNHLLIYRALATAWLLTNGPTILAIVVFGLVLTKALDKLDDLTFKHSWKDVVDVKFNNESES